MTPELVSDGIRPTYQVMLPPDAPALGISHQQPQSMVSYQDPNKPCTTQQLGNRHLPPEISQGTGISPGPHFTDQRLGVLVLLQEEEPRNRDT